MSSMYIRPFMVKSNTTNIAVTGTTASTAILRPTVGIQSVRLLNNGSQTVFVEFGTSGVTAALATSMPLLPYTVETFALDNSTTHIAAIAALSGSTLYITTGESA